MDTLLAFLRYFLPQVIWATQVIWAIGFVATVSFIVRVWRYLHTASRLIGVAVCVISFVSLALFVIVFAIGRSSNVAQLAGRDGYDYWGLWFHTWPLMALSLMAAGVLAFIGSVCPPYRWRDSICRVLSLALAAQGLYSVLSLMPDA